jgi:hypothetical protein
MSGETIGTSGAPAARLLEVLKSAFDVLLAAVRPGSPDLRGQS